MSNIHFNKQSLLNIIILFLSITVFGITLFFLQKIGYKIFLYPTFNGVLDDPDSIANNFIFTPYGLFTYGFSFYFAFLIYTWAKRDKEELRKLVNISALIICLTGIIISIIDAFLWQFIKPIAVGFSHTIFILTRFMIMGLSVIVPVGLIFIGKNYLDEKRDDYLWLKLIKWYENYRDDRQYYYVLYQQKFLYAENFFTLDTHLRNLEPRKFSSYYSALHYAEGLINDFIEENREENCGVFEQPMYKHLQNNDYYGPLPAILGRGSIIFFPVEEAYRQITDHFKDEVAGQSYFPDHSLLLMRNFEEKKMSFISINNLSKSYDFLNLRTLIPNLELEEYIIDHLNEVRLDHHPKDKYIPGIIDSIEGALNDKGYREGQDWDYVTGSGPNIPKTILDYQEA